MNVLNTTRWLSRTSTRKICLTTVCFTAFLLLLFVYYSRNGEMFLFVTLLVILLLLFLWNL